MANKKVKTRMRDVAGHLRYAGLSPDLAATTQIACSRIVVVIEHSRCKQIKTDRRMLP